MSVDFANRIRPLGYDGLDPAIRERDVDRVLTALRAHATRENWPTREVARAVDLKGFPESVRKMDLRREPVPVYLIVNPSSIDEAWSRIEHDAADVIMHPPLDGVHGESIVAFFDPITLQPSTTAIPWPSWADGATQGNRSPRFKGMDDRRLALVFTNGPGWNVVMRARLERQGVKTRVETYVARVSESVWRAIPLRMSTSRPPRGTLVFPLWESTGLLRPDDDTPRTTPLSATIQTPQGDLAIPEAPGFVLVAPFYFYKPMVEDVPRREFVILPETLAAAPVPVVTFTLAPSSRPLAEDYILQVGMPADTEGLFAVCIFATITDEQLAALARALTE